MQEELGQLTNALWDAVWRPANALRACTPEQRERYLIPAIRGERSDCYAVTESGAGSDFTAIESTAEPDGDGYRLNGEKWFVTVGDVADFFIVMANVLPEREATLFLVDKDSPGVVLQRTPRYMHTFVYKHPIFTFENVRVEPDRVLGGVGAGNDLTREWFVEERLMIAARSMGASERALREATEWARSRGSSSAARIIENQLIQAMLAGLSGRDRHEPGLRLSGCVRDRCRHGPQARARQGGDGEGVGVGGGRPRHRPGRADLRRTWLHARVPVERLYRDIRVDRIWEGTSEMQRLIIANEIAEARSRRPAGALGNGDVTGAPPRHVVRGAGTRHRRARR